MAFPWGSNQSEVIKEKGRRTKINVSLPVVVVKREDCWASAIRYKDFVFTSRYPKEAIEALALLIHDASINGYLMLVSATMLRKNLFIFANFGVECKITEEGAREMARQILASEKEDPDFIYRIIAKHRQDLVKRGKDLMIRIADDVLKDKKSTLIEKKLAEEVRENRLREAKLTAQQVLSNPEPTWSGMNLAKIVQYL